MYINQYIAAPSPLPTTKDLRQVDLSSGDSNAIVNSYSLISTIDSVLPGYIQLAPDKKIYVSSPFNPYIGVITNPNAKGTACNFIYNGINLSGKNSGSGLPAYISNYFYFDSLAQSIIYTENQNSKITIYPNPFSSTSTVEILNENFENIKHVYACIYDVLGNENKIDYSIKNNTKNVRLIINAGNLSTGIYILKITLNENTYSQKIIIN